MKNTLAVIALAATLTGVGATAAQATTYPAPAPLTSVSSGSVVAGESVAFAGQGFTPGEQINITVARETAGVYAGAGGASRSVPVLIPMATDQNLSTVADSTGAFSIEILRSEAGVYTLTAVGATSGVTHTNTVAVLAPSVVTPLQSNGTTLANTGTDSGLLLWGVAGLGALAASPASPTKSPPSAPHSTPSPPACGATKNNSGN